MIEIGIDASGFRDALDEVEAAMVEVDRAVQDGAIQIAEEARRRTPVLTGALRSTIEAVPGTEPATAHVVAGGDLPYAVIQHENLSYNHPRGGQARYVTSAVDALRLQIVDNIVAPLRGVVGG